MTTEDIVEAPAVRGPAAAAEPPLPPPPPPSPLAVRLLRPLAVLGGLCLLSVGSAGLLYCCHFPVACGWLAWFGLVPLLLLTRSGARPWLVGLAAYVGGLAFFFTVTSWIRVADPRMYYAWLVVSIYCAVYWP